MEKFSNSPVKQKAMKKAGLKILDIYIIKKFLGTFFYSILLIVSIAVIFDLAEKLDNFMEREAPLRAIVFDYYLNFIPYFAVLFSPLFTFISVIFFTSKMAYNTEIIAILSSGISFRRLLRPYFISAIIIAAFAFVMSDFVLPGSNEKRLDFEERYYRSQQARTSSRDIHKQILPGVYIYMSNFSPTSKIAYNFSIEKYDGNRLVSKMISDYAMYDTTTNKWRLTQYMIRNFNENGETIEKGSSIDTTLNVHPSHFGRRESIVETMSLRQLDEFIEEQRMQGADNIDYYLIERYSRIAFPFSTFILTIIGMSLSSRKVREGIGFHIGLGLLLSFSYILFMRFSTMFAVSGLLSPLVAVWLPNALYAIIAYIIYRLAPK
jgi:lipopolysaccharide export system permease protein